MDMMAILDELDALEAQQGIASAAPQPILSSPFFPKTPSLLPTSSFFPKTPSLLPTSSVVVDLEPQQPGGGMAQPVLAAVPLPVGGWQAKDKTDLLARAYTKTCTEAGIPMRPAGLFPPGEKTLAELVRTGGIPVSKHLWSADEQRWLLAEHSFVAGNEAAGQRGIDIRCFFFPDSKVLKAAVRFGAQAAIDGMLLLSCHGGAIEAVLDEATAELMKLQYSPNTLTRSMSVEILKPVPFCSSLLSVPVFQTLLVECRLSPRGMQRNGLLVPIDGTLSDDSGTVLARASAEMVDLNKFN